MTNSQVDPRLANIRESIRSIPDFPKAGILFRDVTTLLLDHKAFKDTIDMFVERYKDMKIDVVVGIEEYIRIVDMNLLLTTS
ncbi:hypothetical protein R1flu_005199 [Riccia fluitans]|uniref:adenine phosphoribosyltransferase n=1 Tax=Riccia fluitans TaxID=41844 RepID=A0ABD1YSS7_9MARC